jgi:hypothetical protein
MFGTRSLGFGLGAILAGFVLSGCAASKSETPLSPTVAGPIPGVEITAPKPVQPAPGSTVLVDQQPVTLMLENASTNGARPLSYAVEIATDAAFTNKVFVRDSIPPGDTRTSLRLPDPLATGRAYYWHARAQDGANTGPFSAAASFSVVTPVVIGQPTLVSPLNNVTVTSVHPKFVWGNAPRSGPIGAVTYLIEVATTDSFANKVAVWMINEQPNQTSLDSPQDFAFSTVYFWHVRASDPSTVGPWSTSQTFRTPAPPPPPVVAPPISPVPGGGGTAPPDAINLFQAKVYNSPSDVASWPATSTLTRLDLMPSGVHVESTKQDSWPEVVPPGWSGGLQYTLWIVLNINGQWYTSGCIEYWRGLYESGGPVTNYAQDWYYDPIRWGPMAGHQPSPGEQVGFFVTAGDARNNGPISVKERSNVVIVSFPSSGGQSFRF